MNTGKKFRSHQRNWLKTKLLQSVVVIADANSGVLASLRGQTRCSCTLSTCRTVSDQAHRIPSVLLHCGGKFREGCEMNVKHDGRRLRLPASRRLTSDLLWLNRVVPLCGHDRIFRLYDLANVRSKLTDRISWPALFIRAFSLVAQKPS